MPVTGSPMTPLITAKNLRDGLDEKRYMAIFDTKNDARIDVIDASEVVQGVLKDAHIMVMSFLGNSYPSNYPDGTDEITPRLLVRAEMLYAKADSLERHPEYERRYAESKITTSWRTQAKEIMTNLVTGLQRLNDKPPAATAANFGGTVIDNGPRVTINNNDGSSNSGDW